MPEYPKLGDRYVVVLQSDAGYLWNDRRDGPPHTGVELSPQIERSNPSFVVGDHTHLKQGTMLVLEWKGKTDASNNPLWEIVTE